MCRSRSCVCVAVVMCGSVGRSLGCAGTSESQLSRYLINSSLLTMHLAVAVCGDDEWRRGGKAGDTSGVMD